MSFSIEQSGKRDALAKSIRDGDHHKKGEHTQLDQAREYIAEEVGRAPSADHDVHVQVTGHHDDSNRYLNVVISASKVS